MDSLEDIVVVSFLKHIGDDGATLNIAKGIAVLVNVLRVGHRLDIHGDKAVSYELWGTERSV